MPDSAMRDSQRDRVDLTLVFRRLWVGRWWILGSVVLFTGAATAAAFLITAEYRASAVLVSASQDKGAGGLIGNVLGQLGGLASIAGIGGDAGDVSLQEAVAVLESREFTEAFIRDKDLLPLFFPSKWDRVAKRWRGTQADWPSSADGYRYFDRNVREVAKNKETGLVTLSITWREPERAAAWANELVERLNAEMRVRAISRTSDSLAYLEKELASTGEVGTRQAISRLVEAQINQRMLANVSREYAFRFVDRALPPDIDDEVWPNKPLLLLVGLFVGASLGIGGVLLVHAVRGGSVTSR
jgi:uncharacterized protein involved in exopolysaccharide biosynthesis